MLKGLTLGVEHVPNGNGPESVPMTAAQSNPPVEARLPENDGDVARMASLTLEKPWHVRFIELMPLGPGECARVARERFVSNELVR